MNPEQTQLKRRGFFTYAWDLVDEGPEDVCTRMVEEYHCNAIIVNATYHHARVLRPRVEGPKTRYYPGALAAFQPNLEFYEEGGLVPLVDTRLAGENVLGRTRKAAQELGMDFGLWVVGLHNSSLGEERPELCVENLFGDKYTYALCPAQEKNQIYLIGLINDLCSQFSPDRIVLEAVGPLGLKHGLHHELFLTEWDDVLELLFSLCFCPACRENAENQGILVSQLQARVKEIGNQMLEDERGLLPDSFTKHEVLSMLMEVEGLWEYIQAGNVVVSDLVKTLHLVTGGAGVNLEVIPASFHRPISQAWLERASIKSLASVSDGLIISAYFSDPAEVEADLSWVNILAPEAKFSCGLNACSPTPDAATLRAQVRACQRAGSAAVYYYNYGLLSEKRLGWVKESNLMLQRESLTDGEN